MLANKILGTKNWKAHSKSESKNYAKRKNQSKQTHGEDKENQEPRSNMNAAAVVDLSKKIKKIPYKNHNRDHSSKRIGLAPTHIDIQSVLGHPVYQQQLLGFDQELVSLIKPQRIDNDVDTDEQQLLSGQGKMRSFLQEACRMKRHRQYQEQNGLLGEIQDAADVARMQQEYDD